MFYLRLQGPLEEGMPRVEWEDFLFVPDLDWNLYGLKVAAKKGIDVQVTNFGKTLIFTKNGKPVAYGSDLGDLYKIDLRVKMPVKCYIAKKVDTLQLWHERLCHQKRHDKTFLQNLGVEVIITKELCEWCAYGKHPRPSFGDRIERVKNLWEIIHTDVRGIMEVESINEKKFSVIFKDEYSGSGYVYFLKRKSEVIDYLKIFCIGVENFFKEKVREILSDGGKEYNNQEVREFLRKNGVKHTMTVLYTPEQNGVAERDNRILFEAVSSMLNSKPELPRFL